jgi:hypothetical protein
MIIAQMHDVVNCLLLILFVNKDDTNNLYWIRIFAVIARPQVSGIQSKWTY